MKVLISNKNKFLIKGDRDFHSKDGMIKKEDLQNLHGKEDFSKDKVETNTGVEYSILEPEFLDLYERIKRGAQIISLKDVGAILTETGVGKDSNVLDAGVGSGALSIYLAHFCKSVTAYELREDFAKIARGNIEKVDVKNIKVEVRNIYEGIDEINLDLITLDLREPWKAVKHCAKALRRGGFLVGYTPQITQALDLVNAALEEGFILVKVKETAEREWKLSGQIAKPITPLISHTGFLTFLRRV
ncbi:MAG: methyltransferase domain-containing protein [Nanoarchaeota archaeon]|nr:methyltransferase domain-containing protein [Nanoarchaeota archaeon]